jgi:hypothetical protein
MQVELRVQVSGRDRSGNLFAQNAVASSISSAGALLSGIAGRCGPETWYGLNPRREKPVSAFWVRESESEQKTQAAVHKVENEKCPRVEILQSPRN